MPVVQQDEIEDGDAPFDEVNFVETAIADVLAFDLPIEAAGEQVIYDAPLWKAFRTDVFEPFELAPEQGRALAPMSARKAEKLARQKVAGMGRDDIKKARFFFGVAKRLESVEMRRCNVHSVRIPAVISRSSRMRRRRDASSGRLYREKPAAAFSEMAFGRYSRVANSRSTCRTSRSEDSYSIRKSGTGILPLTRRRPCFSATSLLRASLFRSGPSSERSRFRFFLSS